MNNVSFVTPPSLNILQACYFGIAGVMVLEYNASVKIILQGTNVLAADNHPIHLHGYSFYVVGWGQRILTPLRILQDMISLIHTRRLRLEFRIMDGQRSDSEQITLDG
ncbi:hypothetical protein D5086_013732 [Populus alba]|uniref:Uncharacterized protein n=1 Tax=Populus alba TaxID=43335 RepID=A0ACC4C7F2_POPAL